MEAITYLWKDRKRHLGLPLSFTRYSLSEDRLFCETGLLNMKSDEILLYRVRDLRLTISLGQRISVGPRQAPHASHRAPGRGGRPGLPGVRRGGGPGRGGYLSDLGPAGRKCFEEGIIKAYIISL